MSDEKNDREASLLKALEAAGTAVSEAARYSMQVINEAPTAQAAPRAVPSPPADAFDTRQWRDDETTRTQSENYYLHFKPGGVGNPNGEGARNDDLARLYAFLFTQKDPGTGKLSFDLWMRWQRLIHDDLAPMLAAAPPDAAAVRAKVNDINAWLRDEINAFGDPAYENLVVDLSVAQYVVLSHAIVTQKEHKLLSPWGGTLDPEPKMFW